MERYALVKNGIVENLVIWDGVSNFVTPGFDKVEIAEDVFCDIGFTYDSLTGDFSPPPPGQE